MTPVPSPLPGQRSTADEIYDDSGESARKSVNGDLLEDPANRSFQSGAPSRAKPPGRNAGNIINPQKLVMIKR